MASNARHEEFLAEQRKRRNDALTSQTRSMADDEMRACKHCGFHVGTKNQCLNQGITRCPQCGSTEAVGLSQLGGQAYTLTPGGVRAAMQQGGTNASA